MLTLLKSTGDMTLKSAVPEFHLRLLELKDCRLLELCGLFVSEHHYYFLNGKVLR